MRLTVTKKLISIAHDWLLSLYLSRPFHVDSAVDKFNVYMLGRRVVNDRRGIGAARRERGEEEYRNRTQPGCGPLWAFGKP